MTIFTWQLRAASLSHMYGAEVPAYYRGGDPTKPVVYEDFLPASAAGILRSNLDRDAEPVDVPDESHYSLGWMSGAIGHHIHDPYALYEKAAS